MTDRDTEFRAFFDAEFGPLRRLAYLLTGDWVEAEDLAQETMMRVYRSWSSITERERPAAYARTVLVNRHRSMLRRAKVEAKHALHRRPSTPETVAPLDEDHLVVWQALMTLPPRERQVVVLRFYEDLPQAEIARVLGCPVGTVKSITHRALNRLKDVLSPEAMAALSMEEA